jgi:hypothetical protein
MVNGDPPLLVADQQLLNDGTFQSSKTLEKLQHANGFS